MIVIGLLIVMGILSSSYGIFIHKVGSGTKFWMIWEAIAVLFWILVFLIHKQFFVHHHGIQVVCRIFTTIAITVFCVLNIMIVREFHAAGQKNLDYIIVLGAQVRENGPSVVLKYRLDKAVEYLNENPTTQCIVSGGQGSNEPHIEAKVMYEYLVEQGIDANRILMEEQSTNTVENIRNSKELLKNSYNGVGIVTNNFHIFRAVQIAKTQKLQNVCGIAADSTIYYLPNNMLRECLGILKDWLMNNI